ncbi:MAG: septum formation protein Maf [Oscillospiraceae bacterium]|nr:septum formation protein Maf [Oscillospiraceae bacterium]
MGKLILASGSPRRQELLRRMGLTDFVVAPADVAEWYPDGLTPEEIVAYISREKNDAVDAEEDDVVITADTMVFLDNQKLGKPHSEAHALEMLTALQGRHHTVCTGVTVRRGDRRDTRAVTTEVYFRPASEERLRRYVATGEPMDKAGAYGIQGLGGLLVEKIHGDFFNVMGLPIATLADMLGAFGVEIL